MVIQLKMLLLLVVGVTILDLDSIDAFQEQQQLKFAINDLACKTDGDCPSGAACGGKGKCRCLIGYAPHLNSITPTTAQSYCVPLQCTHDVDCVKLASSKHPNKYVCDRTTSMCVCNTAAGYKPDKYRVKCKQQQQQQQQPPPKTLPIDSPVPEVIKPIVHSTKRTPTTTKAPSNKTHDDEYDLVTPIDDKQSDTNDSDDGGQPWWAIVLIVLAVSGVLCLIGYVLYKRCIKDSSSSSSEEEDDEQGDPGDSITNATTTSASSSKRTNSGRKQSKKKKKRRGSRRKSTLSSLSSDEESSASTYSPSSVSSSSSSSSKRHKRRHKSSKRSRRKKHKSGGSSSASSAFSSITSAIRSLFSGGGSGSGGSARDTKKKRQSKSRGHRSKSGRSSRSSKLSGTSSRPHYSSKLALFSQNRLNTSIAEQVSRCSGGRARSGCSLSSVKSETVKTIELTDGHDEPEDEDGLSSPSTIDSLPSLEYCGDRPFFQLGYHADGSKPKLGGFRCKTKEMYPHAYP